MSAPTTSPEIEPYRVVQITGVIVGLHPDGDPVCDVGIDRTHLVIVPRSLEEDMVS